MSEVTLFRGNTRIASLARWFREVPEGAVELVLLLSNGEGGFETVQRWRAERVQPSLANDVEDAIQGYLEETRQSLTGYCKFLDERGEVLASKRLRCKLEGQSYDENFDGTQQSIMQQYQQHQQHLMDVLAGTIKYVVSISASNSERDLKRALDAERRLEQERERTRELEEALLAVEQEANTDGLGEKMGNILEMVAAKAITTPKVG